jgi:hypothetical protein
MKRFTRFQTVIVTFILCSLLGNIFLSATHGQSSSSIGVRATVPASPTDFQAELVAVNPDSVVSQNKILTYEMSYGTYLSYPATSVIVQTEWSLGTIAGDATPTIAGLNYVTGSATIGYNNTVPVVDPINRRITWTFPVFPANISDQKVTFQLRTTNTYKGVEDITFTITGRVLGSGTSTPDSTLTQVYKTDLRVPPTETPGIPSPSRIPTATPIIARPFQFGGVAIDTIGTDSASLQVQLTSPGTITVAYGQQPNKLTSSMHELIPKTRHLIYLTALAKNQTHYFQVTAKNDLGKIINSDIFTFITAKDEQAITIIPNSILLTSNNVGLYHPQTKEDKQQLVVIPQHAAIIARFTIADPTTVHSIELFLRNDMVLAASALNQEELSEYGLMQALASGDYVGQVTSDVPGKYTLFVRLIDNHGNIAEQAIATVRISQPFQIFEKGTGRPIEHAKVLFSVYNQQTKIYDIISQTAVGIQNPMYSTSEGIVPIVLPVSEYKAAITALGYEDATITFLLGADNDEIYPTVYLEKQPFTLLTASRYIYNVTIDSYELLKEFVMPLAVSFRFYTATAALTVLSFVLLTAMALLARLQLPIKHIPVFFVHHWRTQRFHAALLNGNVVQAADKKSLTDARVVMIEIKTGKVVTQTTTDKSGHFHFRISDEQPVKLSVIKTGYQSTTVTVADTGIPQIIALNEHKHTSFIEVITFFTVQILSFLFESMIALSVLLEVFLWLGRGFLTALPLVIISMITFGLWEVYKTTRRI